MKKIFYFLCWLVSMPAMAQYHSLLWQVSGNGVKAPSYLFGTMHTADGRIIEKAERAKGYFEKCPVYAMELDPNEAFDMGLMSKLMMGKGHSLKKMIPEPEYLFLDSLVKQQVGFSLALFDNVAPVFVMTILETAGMGLADSSEKGTDVMDMLFYNQAKEQRKEVLGIETVDEQLKALTVLNYQEQADMLVQGVKEYKENAGHAADLIGFYVSENLDSLGSSADYTDMPEKFYKALVTERNKRMANRIAGMVTANSTFIAVGALHLPGDKGVIELLRRKGFLVEPVK